MDINKFAAHWIESWNSHDVEEIISHYAEDVEITTPLLKLNDSYESGSLKGKILVKNYFYNALKRFPDLHFELLEVTSSKKSVEFYYKSVMNKRAIEVMFFNDKMLVNKIIVSYFNVN